MFDSVAHLHLHTLLMPGPASEELVAMLPACCLDLAMDTVQGDTRPGG